METFQKVVILIW